MERNTFRSMHYHFFSIVCVVFSPIEAWSHIYVSIGSSLFEATTRCLPDSKVYGANMGPIWGRQDPGRPNVGPMNFAIRAVHHYAFA